MVNLNYRDARPIYSQIVDGFREQIAAGILQPGDRLPSVRELATALTINPNTIQRAYRELEAMGLIESIAGKGSFVCHKSGREAEALAAFDAMVASLLEQGISEDALIGRIRQGGMNHD